jgi:ribosomal protein S18 acetylase RimI-like enzyme
MKKLLIKPSGPVAQSLRAPLPLGTAPGELVLGCTRNRRRYAVYCGHAPGTSAAATVRSLHRKLRESRAEDEEGEDVTTLSGQSLAEEYAAWSSLTDHEDCGDGEYVSTTVRAGYQLVAYTGRSSVGYCTFVVCVDAGVADKAPSIEVEVLEIWLAPRHRGIGVGDALAQGVAQLSVAAVVAIDQRMNEQRAPNTSFRLTVAADVYSSSGARFLGTTAQYIKEQLAELVVLFSTGLRCIAIDDIAVDPR